MLVTGLVAIGIFGVAGARADYEQAAEHFGASGEARQLKFSTAMAVNVAGVGGVEAGSIYVVTEGSNRVLRFSPGAEGEEPRFREAWGWGIAEGGPPNEFVRCGPAYAEIPEGSRPSHTFAACEPVRNSPGGEQVGHFNELGGVAVNQATGDVYVLNLPQEAVREHHVIEAFTATGTPIGEGFGDLARKTPFPSEAITESPEKLHARGGIGEAGLAVTEAGVVYVMDRDFANISGTQQARIMSFEPEHPGNYESYVYAGQGKDITTSFLTPFRRLALAGSGRLVTASTQLIREYSIGGGSTPICTKELRSGQIRGTTANPRSGEVFYFTIGLSGKLGRLGPCDVGTGEFEEVQAALSPTPATEEMYALAVNPSLSWSPQRAEGVLYGVDAQGFAPAGSTGIGDVFVPAVAAPPVIEAESVTDTTSASSTLQARIDRLGAAAAFHFEYLTRAQYDANEPNELQSVTVTATDGLFGLAFEGARMGGEAIADLASGSTQAADLKTATATATLSAAAGMGNLGGAVGKGTVSSGLASITGATATSGSFVAGQGISGEGIPSGTTITKVEAEGSLNRLTISAPATKSAIEVSLTAGANRITGIATEEGAFKAGQQISGAGIPAETTIVSVGSGELTLSRPATSPGAGIALKAGSTTLTSVVVGIGKLESGRPIQGEGIPSGATVVAVNGNEVLISKAATKAGTAIAISDPGPYPLAVGEAIEGSGIAPGTTIAAIEGGKVTLSKPAEVTQVDAQLRAGLPFDSTATQVRRALEGLSTIGKGNVEVTGGPGDGAGSDPYKIEFTGALTNQNLPALAADASGLAGGPATAIVATLHEGGGGFVGAMEAPAGGAPLPQSGIATAAVSGLSPETGYVFRVVAQRNGCPGGPSCETDGAAATFRTYPPTEPGLPDGRAYELVSPAQKHGGEVFPADQDVSSCLRECKPPGAVTYAFFPMQSTGGGDAVSYMGNPFSPEEGAAVTNSYISRRTSGGWQTTAMSPRRQENTAFVGYSGSLDRGVITTTGNTPLAVGAPVGYPNLYLQDADDPANPRPLLDGALFTALAANQRPYRGQGTSLKLTYAGHSPDFSAQYFEANDSLTFATAYAPEPPDPGSFGRDLYEWHGGNLSLVNVLPGNGAVAVDPEFASASPEANGIAAGGRRVFWAAGGHLYMREDNRTTREIHHPGSFITASPDGLEVLLSDGCLYSLTTTRCSADLTQGAGGFLGIAGQSEDLGRIYFVDSAALAGQNERGEVAELGKPNLYLYEAGAGTRFIATLVASDGAGGSSPLDDWAAEPGGRTAEASPDGRYLAFGSTAPLIGYGNVGPCERVNSGGEGKLVLVEAPCTEVYLYDSSTGRLTCPSCNPTGEAPRGPSTLRRISGAVSSGAGAKPQGWLPQPRYLTDQGRLVFDSSDRLSPRDTNGRVEDVYEAEPAGLGSCGRAAGCVSLVSPGTGTVDSNLLAMDEGGSNVFFTSRQRLVPADTDELIDVYDARVGGGFSSEAEAAVPDCRGEACQAPSNPPVAPNSATSNFQGSGNVKPKAGRHCRKGKVKRHGKCVKKQKKKHSKHRRHKRHGKKATKKQAGTVGRKHGGSK